MMMNNRVVGRFEQGVRDVIARIALRPPIKAADGRFSKSYHLNVHSAEELEDFRVLANDAFEVIGQHFGKDYFSFRFEWGFVDQDGEQVKALIPRGDYGKAIALLGALIFKNQTLVPKKLVRPPLNAMAVWKINQALSLTKREPDAPDALARDQRLNYRPDAPPDAKLSEYEPELWQILLDALLMMQLPERAFVHQAKSRDGWWNKKGRQLAVYKNLMRTFAHNFWAR